MSIANYQVSSQLSGDQEIRISECVGWYISALRFAPCAMRLAFFSSYDNGLQILIKIVNPREDSDAQGNP
jgi:hypothetical protein